MWSFSFQNMNQALKLPPDGIGRKDSTVPLKEGHGSQPVVVPPPPSRGHLAMTVGQGLVLLASSGQSLGMLLNTLRCTGQPSPKGFFQPKMSSVLRL